MELIKGIVTFWVISELCCALKRSFHEYMDYVWTCGYEDGMEWQEAGQEYPPRDWSILDEAA